MTKRDFEALALILATSGIRSDDADRLACDMARYFARVNPLFDPERFFEAACVSGEGYTS